MDESVRAVSTWLGDRRFGTEVHGRTWVTDQRSGPTPPDLFLASLAACIGVYVAGYCRRNEIDATGLEVSVEAGKDDRRLSAFRVDVRLPCARLGARREAVRRVADACLVHETMRTFDGLSISVRDEEAVLAG